MADKPGTTVNFRKLLLNRCQKEFERDKMDDVVFERKQKELDSATSVCVLSLVNIMSFIFFYVYFFLGTCLIFSHFTTLLKGSDHDFF